MAVGKALGEYSLGIYAMAFNLANLPSSLLTTLTNRILFPSLSSLQNDHQVMSKFYVHATRYVAMVALPAAIAIFVLAPNIITVIYTDKWADVIPLLRVLSIYGLVRAFGALPGNVFKATGNQRIMPKIMAVQVIPLLVLLYPIAQRANVAGVAWVMTIALTISAAYSTIRAMSFIHLKPHHLLRAVGPSALASAIMAAVIVPLSTHFPPTTISLVLLCLAGSIVYAVALMITTRGKAWQEIVTLFQTYLWGMQPPDCH